MIDTLIENTFVAPRTEADVTALLEKGREALGLQTGIVSHIVDDSYTILSVSSIYADAFQVGMNFPLSDTYCRDVFTEKRTLHYRHIGRLE